MSKEQLQTPVLQFFEKNLPNLTVSRDEKDGRIVVKRKDKDGDLSMNTADGGNTISLFLQHISMAYPDCSTAMPSTGGFEFSTRTGMLCNKGLNIDLMHNSLPTPIESLLSFIFKLSLGGRKNKLHWC